MYRTGGATHQYMQGLTKKRIGVSFACQTLVPEPRSGELAQPNLESEGSEAAPCTKDTGVSGKVSDELRIHLRFGTLACRLKVHHLRKSGCEDLGESYSCSAAAPGL